MKFRLYRVRLNNGGYDSFGHYYGHGLPLYRVISEETDDYSTDIRAVNREAAKALVRKMRSDATFYG